MKPWTTITITFETENSDEPTITITNPNGMEMTDEEREDLCFWLLRLAPTEMVIEEAEAWAEESVARMRMTPEELLQTPRSGPIETQSVVIASVSVKMRGDR